MPYLSHLVQVCLYREKATPYFRQLASAVGYLHERGITHNDIKPANIMISHNDIPVLVDFGFAHYWPMDNRDAFWSEITWGTPEVSLSAERKEEALMTNSTLIRTELRGCGMMSVLRMSGHSG